MVDGNGTLQNINPSDPDDLAGLDNINGQVSLVPNGGPAIVKNFAALLKGKFDPNGTNLITLQGCSIAQGPNNLAKALSNALPGVKVLGSPGTTYGIVGLPSLGFPLAPWGDNIYINGKVQ